MASQISIVTAFFDIGRGDISTTDYPSYLNRTNNTYFNYFSNLAKLDNEMIIFTSAEFEQTIIDIRKGKPTKVIVFDFHSRLNYYRQLISKVQNSDDFIKKINSKQLKNIEYWSADYVMVTNMKTFFVNQAILTKSVSNNQVAWVDFGYCRSDDTLNGVSNWQYDFDLNKIHFFSINKTTRNIKSYDQVLDFIFNNEVFIIGGCIVASQEKWLNFGKVVYKNQKYLLTKNIVDDDQGVFILCMFTNPELFKVNYLGKNQWFSLFKKYDKTAKTSLLEKTKDYLGI